jgi:lysophospholipase L1-like esterase
MGLMIPGGKRLRDSLAGTIRTEGEAQTAVLQTEYTGSKEDTTDVLESSVDESFTTSTIEETAAEPESTTEVQPESTTEAQPESTTEAQPESTTEAQPESTTEAQPETAKLGDGYVPESSDSFLADEDADEFFRDSVFVGDSVMKGFCNYVMRQEAGFLSDPQFLVSGSYSLRMALTPVDQKTIHPVYQGEQRLIQDSLQMMGAKKVFLFFGLNDLGMNDVEFVYRAYQKFIGLLEEACPDIEVYVISTTYMRIGSEKSDLNNTNIRTLNKLMKTASDIWREYGYIDIADYLLDEEGGLREDYCSDGYVHQTPAAYDVWTHILRCYASGGDVLIEDVLIEDES